jgi:hypothetical protein
MGRGKRPRSKEASAPTWAELGDSWAERFLATFARASFRRLSVAEKQKVYVEMADELVADVSRARPEWNRPDNRSWWAAILRVRFGGNSFWMLSPEGKQYHCQQVGREVELCARIVTTQGILTAETPSGPRSRPSSLANDA